MWRLLACSRLFHSKRHAHITHDLRLSSPGYQSGCDAGKLSKGFLYVFCTLCCPTRAPSWQETFCTEEGGGQAHLTSAPQATAQSTPEAVIKLKVKLRVMHRRSCARSCHNTPARNE
jgi:hypothetical protein